MFEPAGPLASPPNGRSWDNLMILALQEAVRGLNNDEIPVGALVSDPYGNILAITSNRVEQDNDPTAHAEMLALRLAAKKQKSCRLENCILVCTLEPCLMCASACIHARLAGVVFGAADVKSGAVISNANCFDLPGTKIWHMGGIKSKECADLLNNFFNTKRQ